ncbi:hypothetical protein LJC32_05240 [Oscillospiraceae bacterium OttesenSCG-928-F05]|nr:hypothetical protein [Oscillospiraceae bacterium OttesenSCG-928-F05]
MATGDIKKLGTFYLGGTRQARPTLPWRPDNALQFGSVGNIPTFTAGQAIEILDTDSADAYQMQWVEVNYGDKTYLVADRVALVSVSWDDLNALDLIFGKTVTIDGTQYLLRVLTGGSVQRNTSDNYAGGSPTNNEWDQFITNELALSGLPTPSTTDLDNSLVEADRTGAHNQIWNWAGVYSWMQETYTTNSAIRAIRGYGSARIWNASTSSGRYANYGWRPCLEVLKSAPLISDTDRDLGAYAEPLSIDYSVAEGDGEIFSILEVLNTTTIRSLTYQVDGTFTFSLTSAQWAALANGQHTIKISATNTVGTTTRTFAFTKANTPAPAPTINSPGNQWRMPTSGYVNFTPGADTDGNTQTFTLQVASDAAFTQNLQSFTTGLQKLVDETWTDATGAAPADIGSTFRLPFDGLPLNTQRYFRVVAFDTFVSTPSAGILVRIGNVLEFYTYPTDRDTQPVTAFVMLNSVIDSNADVQVFVCNNGNDESPAWEDATAAYESNSAHTFVNAAKTDENWAVAMHVKITANNATGTIEVAAVGLGVT